MKRLVLIMGLAALGFLFSSRHQSLSSEVIESKKTEMPVQEYKKEWSSAPETRWPASDFEKFEAQAGALSNEELKSEMSGVSEKLKAFSTLDFEQFSPAQLQEFNSLNRQRAVLMKNYIFRKYGAKYAETH